MSNNDTGIMNPITNPLMNFLLLSIIIFSRIKNNSNRNIVYEVYQKKESIRSELKLKLFAKKYS